MKFSIAVLMTCHNRVKTTIRCLESLYSQTNVDFCTVKVYLVDDGSEDDTGKLVKQKFPEILVIEGDGSLFWNRGMHKAFSVAVQNRHDYYLWLNDDTILHKTAIITLINTHKKVTNEGKTLGIVASSTLDLKTKKMSYGGYKKHCHIFPLNLKLLEPSDVPIECDTFCGNVVLVPRNVIDRIGIIDPIFSHRWGDVDYGLKAKIHGVKNWICPGFTAYCEFNKNSDAWKDKSLKFSERVKIVKSIKGLGVRDWFIYAKRHGGRLWPLMYIKPYVRIVLDSII